MTNVDIKTLQAVADAVSPGLATVTISLVTYTVVEPDRRRGREGRNRCATSSPCPTCKTSGEVLAADALPDRCPTCDGIGAIDTDPTVQVQRVTIDIGHRCSTSFDCQAHVDGVAKGRRDLFRDLTPDEVAEKVRAQVGCAAFDSHHLEEVKADVAVALALLDAAAASGAIDAEKIAAARAALGKVDQAASADVAVAAEAVLAAPAVKGRP